jgi:hypothetical protein
MNNLFAAALLSGFGVFSISAQWIGHRTPGIPRLANGNPDLSAPTPRMQNGRPDLSGVWRIIRPRRIPAGESSYAGLTYWLPNNTTFPLQPWAAALFQQRAAHFGAGRPSERCLPHGIPDAMLVGLFKLIQTPQSTIVLYEEFNHYREIFTDGRELPHDPNPSWFGYSIGKWTGDTFGVDSIGFNDRTWLDDLGLPHSDAMHTIEAFRRRDLGHMDMDLTVDDPKAYTRNWTVKLEFELVDTDLIEDVCDNEKDSQHVIR